MSIWSIQRIRNLVKVKFKKRACLFQIKVARALRERRNDVVAIAATGSGKTLSFWIPLLMAREDNEDACIIVVTPLNLLGQQNVELLSQAGLQGVAIDGSNATDKIFRDVAAGKYQVISINPEILMQEDGHCQKLWKLPSFTSRLLYIVFDEGHCISEWNSFREQYKYVGSLRHLIPGAIPFYLASATLPTPLLADVTEILQLRKDRTDYIFRSNDRPNIALSVRKMQHAAHTFRDLDFLIPPNWTVGDPPPPRFLVFCNTVKETEAVCRYLRKRLPSALGREKIKYFHASMSSFYRVDEYEAFRDAETFGLCVTDAFGMGVDIPGIQLIIQWKVPGSMNTLWQRFGRAARGLGDYAFAILIAEKQHFDEEIKKRDDAKVKRKEREDRKRRKKLAADVPQKRAAQSDTSGRPHVGALAPQPAQASAHRVMNSDSENDADADEDRDVEAEDVEAMPVDPQGALDKSLEQSVADEERRRLYNTGNAGVPKSVTTQKASRTIQPAILDLINADVRNIGCRRRVITLVYSNDKRVFDHKECDEELPSGCLRCSPMTSIVCCDLCHPLAFLELASGDTRLARGLRKSTVKKYAPDQQGRELRAALLKWRNEENTTDSGPAPSHTHGNSLILPLPTLQRIIDCAHIGKLSSPADFRREVEVRADWDAKYLDTVLKIVHAIYPPQAELPAEELLAATAAPGPSGTNTGEQPGTASTATASSSGPTKVRKPRKQPTCSRCGQVGHIKRNRDCPARIPAT